ncbi:MAG: hypothetical protein INQ03_05270 [Candidatus Heimdallarchaeota archaeon]|nr:hypothetical protein [Candidatus Heimdallarchaeota archaeon]
MDPEIKEFTLETEYPIDLSVPKPYLFAHTPLHKDFYRRCFKYENQYFVCTVTQEKPLSTTLSLTIESDETIVRSYRELFISKIRYELGLDEKMKPLRRLGKRDRFYRKSLHHYPGFRLFANSDVAEAAVLTILSQNVIFSDYIDLVDRLFLKYGDTIPWDTSKRVFPDINTISDMELSDWRALEVMMPAKYLAKFNEDIFEDVETYTYYPVFERGIKGLSKIPGIANYTSRILMVYAARRYDLAIYNKEIRDIIENKFNLIIPTIFRFDQWIQDVFPKEPALLFHPILLEYHPQYRSEFDFSHC